MTRENGARRSRTRRVLSAFAGTLLVVVPLGYVITQFWLSSAGAVSTVDAERHGVAYLPPTVSLVATLTTAQSAAVRGDRIPTDVVRRALDDVNAVDLQQGGALGSTTRWTALRGRIERLTAQSPAGADAYQAYSEITELALALIAKVGDNSELVLDREVDSHYLADTALLRLPSMLVDAGRYADLVTLARTVPVAQQAGYTGQAAVARDRVGQAAAVVDEALRRGLGETGSRQFGPRMIGLVDGFRTAAADLAPLVQLTNAGQSPTDAAAVGSRREQFDRSAVELDKTTLATLDAQLAERARDIAAQRLGVIVAAVLALVGAGWVLWMLLPAQHRRGNAGGRPEGEGRATAGPGEEDDSEPLPNGVPPDEDALVFLDARELLADGELVRIGRAVKRSRQEPEDDPH